MFVTLTSAENDGGNKKVEVNMNLVRRFELFRRSTYLEFGKSDYMYVVETPAEIRALTYVSG
jgi:hypothetical protein